jgi:uncharacterized membrane protein YbhN (UPF0104 family)
MLLGARFRIDRSRLTDLGLRHRLYVRLLLYALPTAALVLAPLRAGPRLDRAVTDASAAQQDWVVLATACFLSAALASAAAWRSALTACNGTIGFLDTASRYAVGCLVNTFVPVRLGDAVRVGLLSRAFEERSRVLTTTGVLAFLGVARAAALMLLLLPAVAWGFLSGRMLAFPAALVVAAAAVVFIARRRMEEWFATALLDAFRVIGRSPASSARVVGWLFLSSAARLGAAAASAAALGVSRPVAAAAIIVPALEISNLVPLTPGNVGITSGVVALALKAQGVDTATALAVGITFHALETIVGVAFGVTGTVKVFGLPLPVRRFATVAALLATLLAVSAVLAELVDIA